MNGAHVIGKCWPLVLFLAAGAGEAGIVLERYGPLPVMDKVLLKNRTKAIVDSEGLSACEKWLHATVRERYGDAAARPEFQRVVSEIARTLKEEGHTFTVKGNHVFAESELHDAQKRLVMKIWWGRDREEWWILFMTGLIDWDPSPYAVQAEKFLQENAGALKRLLEEFILFDQLSSSHESKPILVVTGTRIQDGSHEEVSGLRYVPADDMGTWRATQLAELSKEYRVCELRVRQVDVYGVTVRIWYVMLGYPTGMRGDAAAHHHAYAYLQRVKGKNWVVMKLRDRSIFGTD